MNATCADFGPLYVSGFYLGYHGYGCNSAFPGRDFSACGKGWDDRCNLLSVWESSKGIVNISWDITQSRLPIIRPDMTVNGSMHIYPPAKNRGAKVQYYGEGFPSEEMYYYGNGGRTTLFRHRGQNNPLDMFDWLGRWNVTKYLPVEVYDRPKYA